MGPHNKIVIPQEELERLYALNKRAVKILADKYGCTVQTIYRNMREYGIERRGFSESKTGIQAGSNNHNWKGGRTRDGAGYQIIRVNGKQVREHRHVMQVHLGRELSTDEVIHHINGDKLDNRIENLQLTTHAEHSRIHWIEKGYVKPDCRIKGCGNKAHARMLCSVHYGVRRRSPAMLKAMEK